MMDISAQFAGMLFPILPFFCFVLLSLSEHFRGGGNMHSVGTVVLLNLVAGKIGVYGKNVFGKILTCIFPGFEMLAGLG